MLSKAAATTVLVVEDEPILRMDAVDLLEDAGFAVVEAANGAAALKLLAERDDIGLLFTDVHMPGQPNGFALAHQVHADRPEIAIVVCSGLHEPGPGDLPAEARFIAKPFTPRTVLEAIKRLNLPRRGEF